MAIVISGCSSQEKEAKVQASWDAASRMTVRAWAKGSVSGRFAADTLKTAGRETKNPRYEAAREAVLKGDRSGALAAIGP